jgi:hypothetical protein
VEVMAYSLNHRKHNTAQQKQVTQWFAKQKENSIKDAAIRWACEQDDAVERLMRLLNNCVEDGDCLIWAGASIGRYGATSIVLRDLHPKPNIQVSTHRFVFGLVYGPDELPEGKRDLSPDDLVLDHLCGEPMCLQPQHLQVITQSENSSMSHQERVAPPLSFGKVIA